VKNILYLHAGAELYGADKVLLDLVSNLDKNKYTPFVLLPNDGILRKKMEDEKIKVEILPYPILRRKYFNPVGIMELTLELLKYSQTLKKYVKKNNIDIVHVNTTAVLEGVFFKFNKQVKVLWHVHEIIVKPKIVNKGISFLVKHFSDKIVAVSKATEIHFIESGQIKKDKIDVIYNGVDNLTYHADNTTDYLRTEFNILLNEKVIGMIGRVNSWKGQMDFIIAVEPILKKNPNWKAILVGSVFEGEEHFMNELKSRIAVSEVKNQIIISEFRDDIQNIHNLFDIFVLPSINPDPLPTVVLESMATSKPIVGYAHGGVTEMVRSGSNGILVEPNNVGELSLAIDQLVNNEKKRIRFGQESLKKQVQYFSLKAYVKKFEDKYESMS
jgi:glycosyltransferase involved in cell wall biosynthesis